MNLQTIKRLQAQVAEIERMAGVGELPDVVFGYRELPENFSTEDARCWIDRGEAHIAGGAIYYTAGEKPLTPDEWLSKYAFLEERS